MAVAVAGQWPPHEGGAMRVPVLAIILILLVPATSSAQQTLTQEAQAQMHRGSVKIWLGVALIGAGAFVIPVSAASSRTGIPAAAASVGTVLIGAGTYIVW